MTNGIDDLCCSMPRIRPFTIPQGHVMSADPETIQETTSIFVSVSSIDIPKSFKAPVPASVDRIANSFKSDGQLQPIGLRRSPDATDRYVLIFGNHRFHAALQNAWPLIEAKVFDMDETEAEAATIAEN